MGEVVRVRHDVHRVQCEPFGNEMERQGGACSNIPPARRRRSPPATPCLELVEGSSKRLWKATKSTPTATATPERHSAGRRCSCFAAKREKGTFPVDINLDSTGRGLYRRNERGTSGAYHHYWCGPAEAQELPLSFWSWRVRAVYRH